jgi:hypothetical protein
MGANFKKILVFPPFITLFYLLNVFGFLIFRIGYSLFCRKWGDSISLSFCRLATAFWESQPALEVFGSWAFFKLMITPLLSICCMSLSWNKFWNDWSAIMESAMAPMITASILATTHGLKPRLSSMMIGLNSSFFYHIGFLVFCFEF